MPTAEEHAATIEELKKQLSMKIAEIDAEEFVSSVEKRKREAKAVNGSTVTSSQTNNGGGNADAGDEKDESASTNVPTTANEVIKNQLLFLAF